MAKERERENHILKNGYLNIEMRFKLNARSQRKEKYRITKILAFYSIYIMDFESVCSFVCLFLRSFTSALR